MAFGLGNSPMVGDRARRARQMLKTVYRPVIEDIIPGEWKVCSQTGKTTYTVSREITEDGNKKWKCTCPDYLMRRTDCKHIILVKTHNEVMKHACSDTICYHGCFDYVLENYLKTYGGEVTSDPESVTCHLCKDMMRREIVNRL